MSAPELPQGRSYLALCLAALALYAALAIGLSLTRAPICDEGWYTSPALSLIANGGMGSPVIESAGIYLKGIERYTYWEMPLHAIVLAPWYRLFGTSLVSTRMLSAMAGLAALLCWFTVIRKVTGDRSIALIALLLMAIDSNILILASTGRSDMLSAAFGAAALAVYLSLREDHLHWALFSGHACAVASGLTHPQGGLIAVPSLLLLQFYYDRNRLRWPQMVPIALPYLIGGAAWSAYILQDPESFWAQFSGNSAGRLWPLKYPLLALRREITGRFLPAYGILPEAHRVGKLRIVVLIVYMAAVLGLWWPRAVRRMPAARIISGLIAIVLLVLVFLEGAKQPWYLIHLGWLLAAAAAASYKWHTQPRPAWRPVWLGALAALILLQSAYAAALISQGRYASIYRPVIAVLQRDMRPGQLVMGSAELGFGLGFDRVLDDANLGYYSGKRADFIVIDSNYRAHLAELARSRPALYGDLEDMLAGQYRPVYSNTGYSVYARVRDAKVGIPATRLKSTDRSMLSFIRVPLRSSAARYAFLPAQREKSRPAIGRG
jgi:4-amino-4-deoxy-L-arabinose transferase-like glycosyltransferase